MFQQAVKSGWATLKIWYCLAVFNSAAAFWFKEPAILFYAYQWHIAFCSMIDVGLREALGVVLPCDEVGFEGLTGQLYTT